MCVSALLVYIEQGHEGASILASYRGSRLRVAQLTADGAAKDRAHVSSIRGPVPAARLLPVVSAAFRLMIAVVFDMLVLFDLLFVLNHSCKLSVVLVGCLTTTRYRRD